jgi:phosphohistidine swiveling domain-containing protein
MKWKKIVTRSYSLYKVDVYFRGIRNALKRHFDIDFANILVYTKGKEGDVYIGSNELEVLKKLISDHFLNSIRSSKDPFELLDKVENELVANAIETAKKDISSKKELISLYKEFIKKLEDYQLIIWFPTLCEKSLFNDAKKRLLELTNNEKAWSIIVEPFEPSIIQEEFINLLKVAIDYSDEKLKEHQKKYEWFSMRFVDYIPYDLNHFKQRLNEIKNPKEELERIEKELVEKKKRFYALLDSLDLSREDKELFINVNKLNQLRQTRDSSRRKAYYHIKPFFDKLLGVLKCDYNTFMSHINDEIVEHLEKNINLKLDNKIQEYIYLFKNNNFEFITEAIKDKLEGEGVESLNIENITQAKGNMACPGKVKGKVKLITVNNWKQDVASLKKGEILVAISTKPEYILAMERAAAFVTDEGGITCHAAIVSREMNKPCIVGTNTATKFLKNGDLVEVDANKGIIRKIK